MLGLLAMTIEELMRRKVQKSAETLFKGLESRWRAGWHFRFHAEGALVVLVLSNFPKLWWLNDYPLLGRREIARVRSSRSSAVTRVR